MKSLIVAAHPFFYRLIEQAVSTKGKGTKDYYALPTENRVHGSQSANQIGLRNGASESGS